MSGATLLSERSRQLDLFRCIAAVFMVFNHAGYHLLGQAAATAGWTGALVFVGSAAPALFFFATGVGSGLSTGRAEAFASAARKVVLLLVADAFMNWGNGALLGLDFFGFAAIATATLFALRLARSPRALAAALLALVLATRFGLSSLLRGTIAAHPVLAFVTGIGFVEHVSYPLCPWLAFPLLGFLLGRGERERASGRERAVVAGVAGAGLVVAQVMAARGAVVFRWGTVSLAYFVFAVAIVAAMWLVAGWLATRRGAGIDAALLRGPASLLIVPLHYGLLGVLALALAPPWAPVAWCVATALLAAAVVAAARRIVAVLGPRLASWGVAFQALALALVGGATLWLLDAGLALPRLEMACLGEIVVAMVLLSAPRGRAPRAMPVPG